MLKPLDDPMKLWKLGYAELPPPGGAFKTNRESLEYLGGWESNPKHRIFDPMNPMGKPPAFPIRPDPIMTDVDRKLSDRFDSSGPGKLVFFID